MHESVGFSKRPWLLRGIIVCVCVCITMLYILRVYIYILISHTPSQLSFRVVFVFTDLETARAAAVTC